MKLQNKCILDHGRPYSERYGEIVVSSGQRTELASAGGDQANCNCQNGFREILCLLSQGACSTQQQEDHVQSCCQRVFLLCA